jgi:hypothetical protein
VTSAPSLLLQFTFLNAIPEADPNRYFDSGSSCAASSGLCLASLRMSFEDRVPRIVAAFSTQGKKEDRMCHSAKREFNGHLTLALPSW